MTRSLCLGLLFLGLAASGPHVAALRGQELDYGLGCPPNGPCPAAPCPQAGPCPLGGASPWAGAGAGGAGGGFGALPCRDFGPHQPDLFYNFYVPPLCGSEPAQLYLAPRPVPAMVGHTYYTYQPFLPHEMLHTHERTYYHYYNGGRGFSRTKIEWNASATSRAATLLHSLRIPR